MLTKDLLKYTVRGEKIFPKYVKISDSEALGFSEFLLKAYKSSPGRKLVELNDEIKAHPKSSSVLFSGLNKLLEERCEFLLSEDLIEELRWSLFKKSKDLRNAGLMAVSEFEAGMSSAFRESFEALSAKVYGDLPEFRSISSFEDITAEALIHRYNASQIQGLILRTKSLKIKIKEKDPVKKRRFLQRLKFWRLLAEISESSDELDITLSGPLSMFDSSANYGGRLSNFFPNVLLMDKWEIGADVKIDEKYLSLEVDSSKPIKSHYQSMTGHIPPEFKEFISIFNALDQEIRKGFQASEGEEVLNLGSQSYVVPDITFLGKNGRRYHVELFHKWHERQLKQRVEVLSKTDATTLILGVAADLCPKEKLEETLNHSGDKSLKMFSFKRFPTPKAILAYLS